LPSTARLSDGGECTQSHGAPPPLLVAAAAEDEEEAKAAAEEEEEEEAEQMGVAMATRLSRRGNIR
jgi:hypothetical protein